MDVGSNKAERRGWSRFDHGPTPLTRSAVLGGVRSVQAVGLVGVACFVLAVVALHLLRGDLNPIQHTISEYSLGKFGWLMRTAFACLGIGTVATAASLRDRLRSTFWRNVGLLLLTGTAIGLIIDAGYNTDHLRVAETLDGAIHGDGMFIVCLTMPTAALILGTEFAALQPWPAVGKMARDPCRRPRHSGRRLRGEPDGLSRLDGTGSSDIGGGRPGHLAGMRV